MLPCLAVSDVVHSGLTRKSLLNHRTKPYVTLCAKVALGHLCPYGILARQWEEIAAVLVKRG